MSYVIFSSEDLASKAIEARVLNTAMDYNMIERFYASSESYSFLNTSRWGEYAEEYFRPTLGKTKHFVYGFFANNDLIAMWNYLATENKSFRIFSSYNDPISPPIFAPGTPTSYVKTITKAVLDFANNNSGIWYSQERIESERTISEWQRQSLALGASPHLRYDLSVNLDMTSQEIWGSIRKSYKPLINRAKRLWTQEIIDNPDTRVWEEFSDLHQSVSGRLTRSLKTWEIQRQWVLSGVAFAVYLRDEEKKLIGAALFAHNQDVANYFTGVYDRRLFDQPVGHLVQWEAILEMQRRRIRLYRIGERFYSGQMPVPSDKDLTISLFKEGFATKISPTTLLSHKATSPTGTGNAKK